MNDAIYLTVLDVSFDLSNLVKGLLHVHRIVISLIPTYNINIITLNILSSSVHESQVIIYMQV